MTIMITVCCCLVAKLGPTVCDAVDYNTPGSSVPHSPPAFAHIRVRLLSDVIQPSHPLPLFLLLPSVFPSIRVLSNELLFTSGGQSITASAPASLFQ